MASKATVRGAGALALVGLLVLVAQPAAVLDAPAMAASQAPETDERGCELFDNVTEQPLVDAELLEETPDAEVCLDEDASLPGPALEEELDQIALD